MTSSHSVVCRTPCGAVRGIRIDGVNQYLRVPYAHPPIGARRFALPEKLESWAGERDATQPGPIPPQLTSRLSRVMGDPPVTQDEDCLHVDVWAPEGADAQKPAPVLVFIHGGAFMTGGGSLPMYRGEHLARQTGLVVVNISYRLGMLGFLPIEGVSPANLGLHDQITALEWIRQNILAFGGDPEQVTLAGQSAGGYSIAVLLALERARGLFSRAIVMSAPLGLPLPSVEQTLARGHDVLAALQFSPSQAAGLRDVPIETLMQAQGQLVRQWAMVSPDVSPPFVPVIDGDLIVADPCQRLVAGEGHDCALIIGYTREEMAAFYAGNEALAKAAPALVEERLRELHGKQWPDALRRAKVERAPGDSLSLLCDLYTESLFAAPTRAAAQHRAYRGAAAYLYRFDWQSPTDGLGACHCIELPFLFGNFNDWSDSGMVNTAPRAELDSLSQAFQARVNQFARIGSPNDSTLPVWPAWHATQSPVSLRIDRKTDLLHCPSENPQHSSSGDPSHA